VCYSATASFCAGSLLSGISFLTVRKAIRTDRSMLVLAFFPLIFGVHQFIEGGVWLTMGTPPFGSILVSSYIAIAFFAWPVLCPLSVAIAEQQSSAVRIAATIFFVVGCLIDAYLMAKLYHADGIDVKQVGHSLQYLIRYDSHPSVVVEYLYAATAILPFLLASNSMIKVFGLLTGIAFAISYLLLREVYFSTWCMAAALLSTIIYGAIGWRQMAPISLRGSQ
jgi:hypothetical protein